MCSGRSALAPRWAMTSAFGFSAAGGCCGVPGAGAGAGGAWGFGRGAVAQPATSTAQAATVVTGNRQRRKASMTGRARTSIWLGIQYSCGKTNARL
ncbi:exported hypothetical protein [Cupriavidus oxalaticus]|uniref:Secreted protein n=1 Tax=Cupriavidus oxalaticus TaxID=96344 RepID=A0A976BE05_9BURK|nr:exported hypothetical protein [Cupriavidus oxalaticus]